MNENDRFSKVYLDGVLDFVKFAEANNGELTTCPCPCNNCKNKSRVLLTNLRRHLIVNGILPNYHVWALHGEKPSKNTVLDNTNNEETIADGVRGMENFVDACYGVYEGGEGDVHGADGDQTTYDEEPYILEPDLPKRYNEYKEKAREKLYPTCEGSETTLSAIVELHNLKKQYGLSGSSVTAILSLVKKWLPKGNTLPDKYPVMKEMLKDLGMKADCIHMCVNNCILYRKRYKDAIACHQCKEPRYKVEQGKKKKKDSKEAMKMLRHFPLIPRLKRLYSIPWIAREMTWHDRATPSWDYMRHPADSGEWKSCKAKWPEFAKEGRNVWLGIATDGFNPRGLLSTSYSCWPVFLIPYNLPPSLCMKPEFQMLSLLIPGPKAPSQDFDVFLEPLFDELMQLWGEGVPAFDMHKMQKFMLRSMLLWAIHDFPALGSMSGCVTHGYKACPICGDETESIRLSFSNKIVYLNYRLFLEMDHPFRDGKDLGLRIIENRPPPQRLKGPTILQKLKKVHFTPGKILKGSAQSVNLNEEDNAGQDDDGGEVTQAFYRRSILFDLEYWSTHKVRHVIDVMHIEKDFTEHLLHTILDMKDKTKDTVKGREDMKEMGIHKSQHMQTDKDTGKKIKPKAPFVLDKGEKNHFVQILKELKLPSGFSSNLSNVVSLNPPSLKVIKSHDYHVIIEYLLPVLLQHAFPKHRDLRKAIHQISLFFRLLCSKVLDRNAIQDAKYIVVEAFCILEKYFPPSFFDISVHLVVHLADEALICGPTPFRWMYPFERSMKDLKAIPSNKRYVEGSIAESYLVSESVRYAMEYMPNPKDENHSSTLEASINEDSECNYEKCIEGKTVVLTSIQFTQIRRWVLFGVEAEGLAEEYSNYCDEFYPTRGKGKGPLVSEVEIQTKFIGWLYKKMLESKDTNSLLWTLVKGPDFKAKTYKKYCVNGFIFSPRYHDDIVITQDSGVCMRAMTPFVSGRKDKNPIEVETTWYGFINEILEVNYSDFEMVLFYCDWVRVEDKSNGCKVCPDSNLVVVNFNKLKSSNKDTDEPVIFATEASQVFYSKDLKNPGCWVVIHSPKRATNQIDSLDVPTDFQSIFEDQPNLKPLMERMR